MTARLVLWLATVASAAPADTLPDPRPERCLSQDVTADLGDQDMVVASGLGYAEVSTALGAVIQTALHCGQPDGFSEVHLTFDMVVGCDGLVSSIEAVDTGGAPEDYVQCVQDVIAKADFPAHDMPDGMDITYPVNVSW